MSPSPSNRETDVAIGQLQGSLSQIATQIARMHDDNRSWQDGHTIEDRQAFERLERIIADAARHASERTDAGFATLQGQVSTNNDEIRRNSARLDTQEGAIKMVRFLIAPLAVLISGLSLILSFLHPGAK